MTAVTQKTSTLHAALVAIITAITMLVATPAAAKKIGGATVPDSIDIAGTAVPLVGGGLRTRSVFKLYAAALYASETGDGEAVAAADAPMAIHLHVLSKLINKKKMTRALRTGFKKVTGGDTTAIQSQIDQMLEAMNNNTLKRGVAYTLRYEPGVGTKMTRDGADPVVIKGLDFKRALFSIWIGDKPAQTSLKKRMLGQI